MLHGWQESCLCIGLFINSISNNDTLNESPFNDTIYENKCNDVINGTGNNNIIIKGASNDVLSGGMRNETIHGGIEFNKIPECPDADNLFGNKMATLSGVVMVMITSLVKMDPILFKEAITMMQL